MDAPNPVQILRLYRQLLKYGRNLQYTDKNYFSNRVRREFKQNKSLENSEEILFNYKKGQTLLERKTVV